MILKLFCLEYNYRLNDFFSDSARDNGYRVGVVTLPFSPTYYAINDPKTLEFVLKTQFESFEKGKYIDARFHDVLGNGIFNADGQNWKIQRKTAANIFNIKAFKDFVADVFEKKVTTVVKILKGHAEKGEIIDLQKMFFKVTLDGFALIGYGVELNSLEADIPFARAFDAAQSIVDYRFISPFYKFEEILTLNSIRMKHHIKVIREFANNVIENRVKELSLGTTTRSDLLSLFMGYTHEDGSKFTREQNLDLVINFIIAGRDTTAQAMSWCVYELNRNPCVLKKLHAEIDGELGDAELTYEKVKNMKYANAVFHETLRLWPSVPKDMKQAVREIVLPCGIVVPAGDVITWSNYAFGRNKNIWGSNALEFYPERWIEMEKRPSKFEYPVFNAGPRVCLGQALAELEGVYVLVSLLRKFDFEVQNIENVRYANSLTLPMKNGLLCKVSARN